MILIGQYDSPFVRRVGITLRLYGMDYEHRPWSVWRDADKIAEHNPLRRVPTLLLDDGTALGETFAIVDALDELAGAEHALLPRSGPIRREGMRLVALSSGLADKAVSLLYWLGHAPTHPDVALTCALRFLREAHPKLFDPAAFPTLEHQASVCEAHEPFRTVYQPIVNSL